MAKELLFVCVFNAGRSAASEYLVRRMLEERDPRLAQEIRVSSAGLATKRAMQYIRDFGLAVPRPFFGRPTHRYMRTLMSRRGIDITGHRSRGLNRVLLDQADLVIAFDQDQITTVSSFWPHALEKVFLFDEFVVSQRPTAANPRVPPFPDGDFVDYDVDRMAPIIADIERCLALSIDKLLRYLGVAQ